MTALIRRILIVVVGAWFAGALADARDAANTTAAAFTASDHKVAETRAGIAKLQASIVAGKARAAALREFARERAVFAYTHPGIDMFVPTGTPAVAVEAGTVTYVPNEGAGGNTAYLAAADGNTYFYAHFSQFVGEARTVAKGEIVGLTGMTGNASAPHLHFEIRLGGPNGATTDPYPTLKSAGC